MSQSSTATIIDLRDRQSEPATTDTPTDYPPGIVLPPVERRITKKLKERPVSTWRSIRRVLTVGALVPLFVIIAARASRIPTMGVLGLYGIIVLLATAGVFYLAFVRYRDPSLDTPVVLDAERPLVSAFIPVKNEEDQIESCVQSMLDSTYPNLELWVINDGSTDGTDDILRRMAADNPRLKLIRLRQSHGKKRALVLAARRARGKYFVYTDSDCWMDPDAITKCVDVMENDESLGAVSGHARALNPDASWLTKMQDVWYDGQFSIAKAAEASFGSVTCVSGPLAVFRRSAVLNYLPAWSNDTFCGAPFPFATDRQLTAYVLGQKWNGPKLKQRYARDPLVADEPYEPREWNVGYVGSARVWTSVPVTFKAYLKQTIRWKKSFLRNFAFNWRWMWRRGPGPAALYYGHALWVVLAPVMAVRHLIWGPITGEPELCLLYLAGVSMKGLIWAAAYRIQNPGDYRWRYRPFISVMSTICLWWVILYSAATVRKAVWSRGL